MSKSLVTAKEFLTKIEDDEKLIRQKLYERVYWEELTANTVANIDGVRVKSSSDGTTLQKQITEIVLIDQEIQNLKNDISFRISVMSKLAPTEYIMLPQ